MSLLTDLKTAYTQRLFKNKYSYKISRNVIYSKNVQRYIRKLDFVKPLELLEKLRQNPLNVHYSEAHVADSIETIKLISSFDPSEYKLVGNFNLTLLTNNKEYVEKLAALDKLFLTHLSIPYDGVELQPGQIVRKTISHKYVVYLTPYIKKDMSSFLNWATDNPNIRLTYKTSRELKLGISLWGNGYFYVKNDKAMTMVKLMLGQYISKVDTVVKV